MFLFGIAFSLVAHTTEIRRSRSKEFSSHSFHFSLFLAVDVIELWQKSSPFILFFFSTWKRELLYWMQWLPINSSMHSYLLKLRRNGQKVLWNKFLNLPHSTINISRDMLNFPLSLKMHIQCHLNGHVELFYRNKNFKNRLCLELQ